MISIKQAVILAGGQGKRLRPFTFKNPKPMIPVNKKPFLEHLINLLSANGIKEVIILTGYFEEKIRDYFEKAENLGVNIKFSYTPFLNENGEENKSGIRIKNAEKLLNNYFLLIYCDNYWPLELKKLVNFFTKKDADVLITVFSNKDNSTKNNIFVDSEGFVTKYDSLRSVRDLNGVDIGFFIINKKILKYLPKGNSKFEEVVLPELITKRKLLGYLTDKKYYSIGDSKRVKITEKFLEEKKVVFLDRDGVINKKAKKGDYIKKWSEFKFLKGSIEAIKLLKNNGYRVFIVTNQAGIARGLMTEADLKDIHRNMVKALKEDGAKVDGIYYCPHGWDEGCDCRKPKPGLLYRASNEHLIDLSKALFIGDDERDKQTGDEAGCRTILIEPGKNLLKIVKSILG